MITPDEANAAVQDALEAWVHSLEDQTEGKGPGIVGDWVAVMTMVDVTPDGHPVAQYYVAMKGRSMLPHVVEGLLQKGIDELAATTGSQED
jgi:hypothetical protein